VIGFLVWATAGHTLPVTGLLESALALSEPLIFGALGGVVSERVGVVNIAIEGQLLAGACVSAVVASLTQNLFAGLVGALIAGVLVSFVLGAFSIKYVVNQVIVGVVLNVLVLGLTTFFYETVLVNASDTLNSPPRFGNLPIPGLSLIPVVGPVLFDQSVITYLMYVAVVAVWVGLYRTRWGLRVRAVGEHPQAADTVGIDVPRTRFWNVALAGAIVGIGGSYFTLGSVGSFSQNMTSGAGYIALAAVIFGGWDPLRASLAGLLFGFASSLQNTLGILGSPVPSDVLLTLPYVVTIFAVAGLVGRVRGPAAAGRPYVKG
jgi:simple sugar transport system permease protein